MDTLLNARSSTGRELFSGSRFKIPIYQREYAWESDQYEILWEDLRGGLTDGGYFLGLIILTNPPGKRKEVVDGQQRIITISLLVTALRDRCVSDRRPSLASEVERDFLVTLEIEDEQRIDQRVARVEFSSNDDSRVFNAILSGTVDATDHEHPMVMAYNFFVDALDKDLGENGFKRLGDWARFLQDGLYFAVFTHPEASTAFTVFEVVNTRGRNLGPADLIKNSLLSITPEARLDDIYERWMTVAGQFDEFVDGAFLQFIRHVAMLKRGYIFPKDLHRRVTFGDEIKRLATLLPDMEEHLKFYLQMMDPSLGEPASEGAARIFASFNALGVSAVRPLLLAMGPEADADFETVLRLTVRIAAVGSLGGVNLERRFSDAADLVRARKAWRGVLDAAAPDRADFVTDLAKRRLRKSTLLLLQRSIVQNKVDVEEIGALQLIRPPVTTTWQGFDEDQFSVLGMSIGNTVLTEVRRRPRDCQTWDAVKSNLVPSAIDAEHKRRLRRQPEWSPSKVRDIGAYLAERAADVWY